MIFLWSIYSTFFTPLEFGFFRGLPVHLTDLDSVQIVFLADVVLQFFVAYLDPHTYKMVHDRKSIALRFATYACMHAPFPVNFSRDIYVHHQCMNATFEASVL